MVQHMPVRFDHIAVVARSLDEGAAYIRDALRIDMPSGGAHPLMGTHNLLLSLGDACYLEVIAIDPDAQAPARPRWFGLDQFDASPKIGTWVLGCDDIDQVLATAPAGMGPAIDMARDALRWRISVREDGRLPMEGACPTLIQWPPGPHPAAGMTNLGCRLHRMRVTHPDAAQILSFVGDSLGALPVEIETGAKVTIQAEIETPSGLCVLQ